MGQIFPMSEMKDMLALMLLPYHTQRQRARRKPGLILCAKGRGWPWVAVGGRPVVAVGRRMVVAVVGRPAVAVGGRPAVAVGGRLAVAVGGIA